MAEAISKLTHALGNEDHIAKNSHFVKRKTGNKCILNQDEDENNNSNQVTSLVRAEQLIKATVFKYTSNAAHEEICAIRSLLAQKRFDKTMSEDEWQFFKSDYERMMVDDWLVSRFLLRGKKAVLGQNFNTSLDQPVARQEANNLFYVSTLELIAACAKFRYEYRVNANTKESEFPIEWTSVNGMLNHGHDRAGNSVAYMRAALHRPKLIQTDALRYKFYRYMLYVLEKCDQDLFQRPGKAICCVFDMTGVAFENTDLELTTWMIKSFKSCAPKLLCYVIIYNPPWFFTATFRIMCNTLLSNNRRQSIKFVTGSGLLDYIDHENLPDYLRFRIN